MIKKISLYLLILLGLLTILITLVAIRLTDGMDLEGIETMLEYARELNGGDSVLDVNSYWIYSLHKVNEYSHIIITASVLCIASSIYLMKTKRRD